MIEVKLPREYGYVLLVAVIYSLQVLLIGSFIAGRARRRVFNQKFMKDNFEKQHQEAFKKEIGAGGYPDMGSGKYSNKLSYKDWFQFNNAQRAHLNILEALPSSLIFLLIAGIYYPLVTSCLGVGLIIGRLIYAVLYSFSGPNGRLLGYLIFVISTLGLFVIAVLGCVHWISAETWRDPVTVNQQNQRIFNEIHKKTMNYLFGMDMAMATIQKAREMGVIPDL